MKSYFAYGVFVAVCLVGLTPAARAQQPNFSSPSLLPLPDARTEYPTTAYPNAPVGAFQASGPAWSSPRNAAPGYRLAQGSAGEQAGGPDQIVPEHVPTPARPDSLPQDWSVSPSDKVTSPYMDAMSSPYGCTAGGEEGGWGFGAGDECGYGGGLVCCGGWYGGVAGLIMGRDRGNPYFWSYYDSNEAGQFLRNDYDWGGGVQASIGHCFSHGCNGCWGIEAVYWGLYPGVNEQTILAGAQPGNLNAILNFNALDYNGAPASDITNAASAHRLRMGYEIHNVEVNLLNFSLCGGNMGGCGGSRFSYNFGAGVRWFRFRDTLQFAADATGADFSGAVDELYYDISTVNDLIGFQLIGQSNYWLTNRLGLTLGTKFGLYGNYIQHSSHIYGAAGDAVINNGPNAGRAWNVNNNMSTVSFLGELDAGLTYSLTRHWSLYGGYRVVGLSNVALTTNQIYPDLRGINDVDVINYNGSLILHGGYAGIQFCW